MKAQIEEAGLVDQPVVFVIHAGRDYYENLVPKWEALDGVKVEIPTEGLQIGKKLAWYGERIANWNYQRLPTVFVDIEF